MPGRASKFVLAAGFVVVFVLVIGLVQLTRSATQAVTSPLVVRGPTASPRAPVIEPPASGAPPSAAREHRPVFATPRGQVAMPVKPPELASAPAGFDRELKRDANGKLVPILPLKDLQAEIHRADAAMKACIERSGKRPTGKATLNFTVGAKNNKLVIDSTGVQDEETLVGYPEILECMHQTANLLAPGVEGRPVPELGTPMYVRRHVRIEDGVLAEDSLFDFSYYR